MRRFFYFLACLLLLSACKQEKAPEAVPEVLPISPHENAIYHWQTVFAPDSAELDFLARHNIGRVYLRMFDVAIERNFLEGKDEVVPIATTQFKGEIPAGVEIVPTVYITLSALSSMANTKEEYAALIVERVLAMCRHNGVPPIREVQFDCDWTATTRSSFFDLCKAARDILHGDSIALSATIRLHQLGEVAPPVDRGVLMLYNTGALKNPETRNSILDIADVKPYMKKREYPLPLDYAYPAFGWGVKFDNGTFRAILSSPDSVAMTEGETIRHERATAAEVLAVKMLVEQYLGKPARGNIIYHLDETQLKHYTDDEIAQIFADDMSVAVIGQY